MPLLEEISDAEDIDNLDMDLAEFDPNLKTAIAPKIEKKIVRSQDSEPDNLFPNDLLKQFDLNQLQQHQQQSSFNNEQEDLKGDKFSEEQLEQLKSLQLIYPCYFDINRSHKEGRRVSKQYSVSNPLAKTIADACASLHLISVYEPMKTHPQDYGNPGRVRVALKYDGKPESLLVNNKRHLLNKIGEYLQKHQTTLDTIKSLPTPPDCKGIEIQQLPKVSGFKMNTIVPLFSRYTLKHPMSKSIYDETEPVQLPQIQQNNQNSNKNIPKQKNKFMHVRR
ncbi:hypothetical protein WICMUC_004562 [Wickerhamomyces mucosus]|uniref:Signal recognition particle SEC65 subunit n=1 Tax=Wickerhamomyces mucosus TaxID=1378264 RepID=A0A9P8PID8_9ASCO|nr:hypothetical protein WICMUC_004562 [Wickerhamomyces mucosus]